MPSGRGGRRPRRGARRGNAGRLDVEAVLEDETAAERRADRHQQRDDDRQHRDPDRRDELGVVVVQSPGDVGQGEHGDGHHDRRVRVDRASGLRAGLGGLPRVPQPGERGEHRDGGARDEGVGARVPQLAGPVVVLSPAIIEMTSKTAARTYAAIGKSVSGGCIGLPDQPRSPLNVRPLSVSVGRTENFLTAWPFSGRSDVLSAIGIARTVAPLPFYVKSRLVIEARVGPMPSTSNLRRERPRSTPSPRPSPTAGRCMTSCPPSGIGWGASRPPRRWGSGGGSPPTTWTGWCRTACWRRTTGSCRRDGDLARVVRPRSTDAWRRRWA